MIDSVAASGAGLSAYFLTSSAASTSSASTQAAASGQQRTVTPAEAGLGDLTDADWKLVSAAVGKNVGPDASGRIQGAQSLFAGTIQMERQQGSLASGQELTVGDLQGLATGQTSSGFLEQIQNAISERPERGSLIVTTNLPFGEWTKVFPDPRLAKAVVARLTHRAHINDTGNESWRFRHLSGVAGPLVETQQAFLELHVQAFEWFGGVFPSLRFDNLKSAVKKVLKGRRRVESDRFVAMRSHYLFESQFTTPGLEGAHEKGGVEGERRRAHTDPRAPRLHLTPPRGGTDMHPPTRRQRRACPCRKTSSKTLTNPLTSAPAPHRPRTDTPNTAQLPIRPLAESHHPTIRWIQVCVVELYANVVDGTLSPQVRLAYPSSGSYDAIAGARRGRSS